jgi:tRNA (guanosine-2'-O-)-methyltransferase
LTWDTYNHLLTEKRRAKILQVASQRTRKIALVLQDVHDPHNVSACLRSADAFGILDCHIIDAHKKTFKSTAARGVSRWLHLTSHPDITSCAKSLRQQGYRLAAGMPGDNDVALTALPCTQPVALLFGNEHAGIDNGWQPYIDDYFKIPMHGMVESLNISVAAAITMFWVSEKMRTATDYLIDDTQKKVLLDRWMSAQLDGNFKLHDD